MVDVFFASIVLAAATAVQPFAVEAVNRRIASADASVALSRFVGYPAGAKGDKFAPNPKFWAKGVDFSCASPWNSGGGTLRAGTLISKRNIIFAKHFPLWPNVRIVFVDNEGGICPCHIDKTVAVPNTDIMIGLLNAEVTPNITPAKILPDDAEKYIGDGDGLPLVTFNQREKLLLAEMNPLSTNVFAVARHSGRGSTNETWNAFRERIIVGDSGNPAFMLVGDQPILLYCLLSGGFGAGPSIRYYRRKIQQAMDDLCPGYKLEAFDFSTVVPNATPAPKNLPKKDSSCPSSFAAIVVPYMASPFVFGF